MIEFVLIYSITVTAPVKRVEGFTEYKACIEAANAIKEAYPDAKVICQVKNGAIMWPAEKGGR